MVHAESRGRGGGEVIDHPLEPFLEGGPSKIDEKPDGKIHQAEIGQQLLAVDRGELFHRLKLHNHSPTDQQVNP